MAKGGKDTLVQKVHKLDPYFVDEVQSLDSAAIKTKIVELAKNREAIEKAKEDDTDLQSLKEQLKTANEGYGQQNKGIKLKTKFLLELLASKGA